MSDRTTGYRRPALRIITILVLSCFLALGFWDATGYAQMPGDLQQLQQNYQQTYQQRNLGDQNSPSSVQLQAAVPVLSTALPSSRLEEIISARAGVRLNQFGYDQLGIGQSITVPLTGAVQDDYVLGPGDEVIVAMRGQENGEFHVTVDRDGRVILPRLSPVPASGRTLGNFRADLEAAVHRSYVATDASVSIGRIRQISVMVSGEVNRPGQRLLTGLSSALDALLLSGGVRKTGSLRNIRIVRGDHEYVVDLYNVLTDRGGISSFRLADGDRILVPPLGPTVAVAGLVRRPGIFELAPRTSSISTRNLLALAGGQEIRGNYRLSVLRIQSSGTARLSQLSGESGQLRDSDILFVQLDADQNTGSALLSGGTGLAGTYPIIPGTRLSDLIKAPGALGPAPYTPFGMIVRKDGVTKMPILLAFTPVAVLSGQEDIQLQSDDVVRILSTNEARMLTYIVHTYLVNVAGQQAAVADPLGQAIENGNGNNGNNNAVRQLNAQTGADVAEADIASVPASIQRTQAIALLEIPAPDSELARVLKQRTDALELQRQERAFAPRSEQALQTDQALAPQTKQPSQALAPQANPPSQTLPQQTSQTTTLVPTEEGGLFDSANQSSVGAERGSDTVSRPPPLNFIDQPNIEGRVASNREVQTFGELSRQLGIDPLVLINFLVDHRVRLDGAVRGPGYYFVGPSVPLQAVVEAAGGTQDWADESGVELISTAVDTNTGRSSSQLVTLPLTRGTLASYTVRPGEIFRFRRVYTDVASGSATIQGEVRYPGVFPIIRGEHLSDLLIRAGGLTSVAYPFGTVYLRQSAAQLEREGFVRAANEIQNELVVAMTRVGNDKIEPNTFASMQTFVTELRNQRALGRISIVADPSSLAANPSLDPLIEAGDVIYIPARPSIISVLGQVQQPGAYPFRAGETVGDYIDKAGGYASTADEGQTFIVFPDGSARKIDRSWFNFQTDQLMPGSAIVIPRDVTPLELRQTIIDVSSIFSQLAVSLASVAVLSKQ